MGHGRGPGTDIVRSGCVFGALSHLTSVVDEHDPEISWDKSQESGSKAFDFLVEQVLPTDQGLQRHQRHPSPQVG